MTLNISHIICSDQLYRFGAVLTDLFRMARLFLTFFCRALSAVERKKILLDSAPNLTLRAAEYSCETAALRVNQSGKDERAAYPCARLGNGSNSCFDVVASALQVGVTVDD